MKKVSFVSSLFIAAVVGFAGLSVVVPSPAAALSKTKHCGITDYWASGFLQKRQQSGTKWAAWYLVDGGSVKWCSEMSKNSTSDPRSIRVTITNAAGVAKTKVTTSRTVSVLHTNTKGDFVKLRWDANAGNGYKAFSYSTALAV